MFLAMAAAAVLISGLPIAARAQYPSQRGQPRTPFGVADFAKLKWMQGDWAGSTTDGSPLYIRNKFTSDSTMDITYYRDSSFSQPTGNSRLYLSVWRVFHSYGPNRWGASHVGADGAIFVPQVNVRSTLQWDYVSPNEWTATQRSGVGGHEHVSVYDMKRVR
jgi:hypothetical protein